MSLTNTSNPNRYYRRLLKSLLIITATLFICIIGLHIWFVHNAKAVLKQVVTTESKGKLKLDLSEFSFDLTTNTIQINEAFLLSTDSLTQPATYHIKFRKLTLRVASFWPLLLQKKLLLDSIKLYDPEITVMQWRPVAVSQTRKEDLSIPQEMGKLYNSMLDVLEVFGIRRIIIDNATISLVNKMKAGTKPVTLSNIYFNLARIPMKKGRRDAFIPNQQTVELTTTDQNIALPGGRHQLVFKDFKLQLFHKRIELDSCTVTAIPTDTSKSSYTIFFKKLLLTGVDFNAMYRYNLIKADSVYCENPLFNITINTNAATRNDGKKEPPDPNKIIQELTGDLDLAFIGVKDAGIHINITGKRDRTLFNSNKDDFEMRGLRISGDSSRPVVVQRFDMLVRDYHLYNEDSSSAYTFDSIQFANNKITLNNFTVLTNSTKIGKRGKKDFKIPYFELIGIDWHALIFQQSLVAQEAALYSPVIVLTTEGRGAKRKKTNLFESLHTLDDFIALRKLNIVNGNVSMQLGRSTNLNLQQVNLSLKSYELLRSQNNGGLRQAVDRLSFLKGIIQLKDISAQFDNARYEGNNLLRADRVAVTSRDRSITGLFTDISIDNLSVDDDAERIILDGLQWKSAQVALHTAARPKSNKGTGNLQLKNITGANTTFTLHTKQASIKTHFETIQLASFLKEGREAPHVRGLVSTGRNLDIKTPTLKVAATRYAIQSEGISRINRFTLSQIKGQDSVSMQTPQLSFAADLNALLSNELHLQLLEMQNPVVTISKRSSENPSTPTTFPSIRIDRFLATTPEIKLSLYRHDSATFINIPASEKSRMAASGLAIDKAGVHIDNLSVAASNATFLKTGSEMMGIEKGKVDFDISNIDYAANGGKPVWNALINNLVLQNPNTFVFGKKKSRLITRQLALGNLNLSSGTISSFDKLMKFNVSAWLKTATGQFVDSTTTLNWYNAAYNSGSNVLSLDSFSYHPTQPLDSVMKYTPFQTDYITFKSGAIQLTDFNLEQYKKDSSILANTLTVTQPVITVYRDKAPPFQAKKIKPLPTDVMKSIPLLINLRQINFMGGRLSYTEKNAKTRAEGTLVLARFNGSLSNISNHNFNTTDSLRLALTAWLMDSAELNLRVKESYEDTLSGFRMTLRMKPTNLTFLNPVLAPLSNIIVQSGTVDSLHLQAIGNDDVAIGAMKMYYRDLRVKLVKDGNETKSNLLRNAASFLANTFFIKRNNNGRTGFVYYERDKNRSFFHYVIRSVFSGMAASIGVKKNSKYQKKYRKFLQDKELPPIEFENQ